MALTQDGLFVERALGWRCFPVSAGAKIFNTAMVALNATGFLVKAGGAGTDKVVGCAYGSADNTTGADGAIRLDVRSDTARPMKNSAGADLIALKDIGADCFAVDDETVSLTDGGAGARARAGKIHDVTAEGVWVWFDK